MLPFGNITTHIHRHRLLYLMILLLFLAGFLVGCFYSNLISPEEFKIAADDADQFIQAAKKNTLSYPLMLWEELIPYSIIFFMGTALVGGAVSFFFIFKNGFSAGFFLSFLIKAFLMKGFFLGMFFLFCQILFFVPALCVVSAQSLKTNHFLLTASLHRLSPKRELKTELFFLFASALAGGIFVSVGVAVKYFILPGLCGYLFA